MTSAALKQLAIVGGLLLLLTYFWLQSRSLDPALLGRISQVLNTFELHDTELDRNVLLARAGLLTHYDSLARAGQNLARTLETLQQQSVTAPKETAQIFEPGVATLAAVLREKLTLLEYFKSDNALLNNSKAYVIHTLHRLRNQAAKVGQARLVAELEALTIALLRFMQTPEGTIGAEIHAALERLPKAPAVQEDLRALAVHGRYIVATLPRMEVLMRALMAAPTTVQARALQEALLQQHAKLEGPARLFRLLLYLTAVALLGYLLSLFARLRANARELRLANQALQQEIAERRQTEAALRQSEERYMLAMQGANEGLWDWLVEPDLVHVSAHAYRMLGLVREASAMAGHTWQIYLHPDDRERFRETLRAHLRGDTPFFQCEVRVVRPDQEVGWVFVRGLGLRRENGRVYRMAGSIGDITARKRLEQQTRQQELQLIQANKMTALGTLISGVAHEINNPNQLVLTNIRLLEEAWADAVEILDGHQQAHGEFLLAGLPYTEMRETIPVLMRDVHEGARHIERIINDLRDFARPSARGLQATFALNDSVQRGMRLLAHLIHKKTERFRVNLAPDLPLVRGDPQHIEQVVVNLVTNALEALPDPSREVTVSTRFDPTARCLVLAVEDAGIGIPPEHLARLCDPFFTTKQASGGTGLGLAISATLVRAHGGQLSFASKPGRGTRAVVTLPCPAESPHLPRAAMAG
ncbi:MAG: PAS domain-containing protein [Burkholderiaceae bacterium]|nr:PAS domain-containing protein [Burkholderiaceae bacterium]